MLRCGLKANAQAFCLLRHCERSAAIQDLCLIDDGLPRCARNDGIEPMGQAVTSFSAKSAACADRVGACSYLNDSNQGMAASAHTLAHMRSRL